MLFLRIRQAEVALADGRLDEAYDIAMHEDVKAHRKGQKLATQLAEKLIERSSEHLADDRFDLAMRDCDRAARLAGNQAQIALLREEASAGLKKKADEHRKHDLAVQSVKQQIANGDLTVGMKLAEKLDDEGTTKAWLQQDVDARRAKIDKALNRIRQAIKRREPEEAVADIIDARRIQPNSRDLADLSRQVVSTMLGDLRKRLDQGRVDRAEMVLEQVRPIAKKNLEFTEAERAIRDCKLAASEIKAGNIEGAHRTLKSVAHLLPGAKWIRQAINDSEKAIQAMESLRTGPLGLISKGDSMVRPEHIEVVKPGNLPQHYAQHAATGGVQPTGSHIPDRFLLQVDGASSHLVVRKQATTFGPVSSSRRPDVGLMAQADTPWLVMERLDEDYFLRSDGKAKVNGQPISSKLLNSGDKIEIGRRGQMKFTLPCAASTSALIELIGARLPRADARRVILFDQSLMLAGNTAGHVQVPDLAEPIMLFVSEGRLKCRIGTRAGLAVPVEFGTPTEIGGTKIVVSEVV